MIRQGGDLITRGRKIGDSNVKQPGILRPILTMPLARITRDEVHAWLRLESAKRPARARIALSALKAFLTWAGDQTKYKALADTSACDRLARELPAKKAKNDCLQVEQLPLWFGAVKRMNNPVLSAYLQILLLTGARRNELAALKWDDVDLQWKMATLKDKIEGQRQIPITPYVASLLHQLPRVNAYVFSSVSAKSGRIVEPRKAHNSALERAGLPPLSIHGLRRSFGTLAEWVECPAGISAQIMGHKPTAIAERHYRRRPIDLLRVWHTKIEAFILEQAEVLTPVAIDMKLKLVA
jgi:integrase